MGWPRYTSNRLKPLTLKVLTIGRSGSAALNNTEVVGFGQGGRDQVSALLYCMREAAWEVLTSTNISAESQNKYV